jgi:sec-independent protein translocase protein TatA
MLMPQQIVILLLLGILLFGRRLPEVARAAGRVFGELRTGLKGIENDLRATVSDRSEPPWRSASEFPRHLEDPPV